jgi:GR25 family glycosyltransferase involved in LPS biosynthesis
MKTLVINLDRNPERWEHAQKALSDVLDDVERISAVDGRLLTDKW